MKSNFSEQELKERALELLYGLLEEDEAEELRLLIASDATAARIFDEARETVDRFARAARCEEAPEAEEDETAAKNVAVETAPFDDGVAFLFGSAFAGADAFSTTVGAEPSETDETEGESSGSNRKKAKRRLNLLRKLKAKSKNERSEQDGEGGKRKRSRKERRLEKKSRKSVNAVKSARPVSASRFRFGSKGRVDGESGWATVGRTASGDGERRSSARRFWARVPKPTLFQNLIIALALVALSTAVGFWAQETALQARFQDDFRIQIAAPRTLARGESQTISATTTAPNGKPRRVPIRFAFSDAETGAPLLAHTESGDASGVARFKIPDVSDFPARTLLTISAGEREKETFETILTVVDAPKGNGDANASARFAAAETVGEIPPLKLDALNSTVLNAPSPMAMTADVATPEDADVETERSTDVGAMGGMSAPTLAATSGDTMGASMGGMSGEMRASVPAPEAASEETRKAAVAFSLAKRETPKFDRSSADVVESLALDDQSSPDLESSCLFSLSGDDKKKTAVDGAEPAFNFAAPNNPGTAADGGETKATTAAPLAASRDELRAATLAELKKASANFRVLANREEIDESDADATGAAEKRGLDVRFYPTGGRLVAGRENVVWFECVDEAGRPVVGEFALNDSEGRVATAKTSAGGVGSLRWTPDADETYSLETAFDGKTAKIAEIEKNGKTGKKVKADKDGDDQEKAAAEEAAPGTFALNGAVVEDFLPAEPPFETFRFPAPTATDERVAFAVPARVLENGKSVELDIWTKNAIPLAATVEKNGVALSQRVWTAKKGRRRVVVPLDANVSGALNVSLWNCAQTPFERIGSAAIYRKPSNAPTLAATLEENDAGERALQIAVDSPNGFENAKTIRLKTFWAPTLDSALGALELDEALLYASDERRVETLATLPLSSASEPILFDNLLKMKEEALEKLDAFWLGEAPLAARVVGLGFVGFAALALLAISCVLLGALKVKRGALVVVLCAALALLFYWERRRIDFSETLAQAIAVSVDESKAARKNADDGATVADLPNDGAMKSTLEGVQPAALTRIVDLDASKWASDAKWSVPLSGKLATTDVGFVLIKMSADDGTLAWKAIPLGERDGEEAE